MWTMVPVDGSALGWQLSTAVVLFHEAVAQRLGLNAADHKALGIIARNGPLTAGTLARLTGLSASAVTGLVDRLERAGHARRAMDPNDRRRTLITTVAGGAPQLDDVFGELSAAMTTLIKRYDERETAAIVDYLQATIEILHEQTRRIAESAD
jgi:DNA-binding MarR family transcriptional regulator